MTFPFPLHFNPFSKATSMSRSSKPFFFSLLLCFACLALVLTLPSQSIAQTGTETRSIEVIGTGTASAKPDLLVLKGFVTAKGKTSKKALGKFLAIKKSLEETINPMDFPDVEVEYMDSVFNTNLNSDDMMAGVAEEMTADGYYLSQTIKVQIKIGENDEEKITLGMLSKLVDSAETAGISFSEVTDPMGYVVETRGSLAWGDISDRNSLEAEATKQAFADAKSQAEKLAELAGSKLGKVISIHGSTATEEDNPAAEYMDMMTGVKSATETESLHSVEVSQSLQVKFELVD